MSIVVFIYLFFSNASDGGPFVWTDRQRSDSDEAARKKLKWLTRNQLVYISDSEWKQGKERAREREGEKKKTQNLLQLTMEIYVILQKTPDYIQMPTTCTHTHFSR